MPACEPGVSSKRANAACKTITASVGLRVGREATHAPPDETPTRQPYQLLAARRGHKKAVTAVAHSLLRIVWHLLAHDCAYVDLGSRYLEERDRQHIQRRLIRRLEAFGYTVKLDPAA